MYIWLKHLWLHPSLSGEIRMKLPQLLDCCSALMIFVSIRPGKRPTRSKGTRSPGHLRTGNYLLRLRTQ